MNKKLILFSGILTSLVGVGLGLVIASMFHSPYTSQPYQGLSQKYMIIGGVTGLLLGGSQEALRQMKHQRDEQER